MDSPNFGEQLGKTMTRAMAVELDRVGLFGRGVQSPPSNEPAGVYFTSGVGVQALLEANVPVEVATANAIMSPRSWAKLEGLPTGISSDKTQLARPSSLQNMAFRVTTPLRSSSHELARPGHSRSLREMQRVVPALRSRDDRVSE